MATMTVNTTREQFTLKATDQADCCENVQAYVVVTLKSGKKLAFCLHHWKQHKDAVVAEAEHILDETAQLTV